MRFARWIYKLRMWGRALFFREAADRELDEEIAYHVAMETDENIARGMAPKEARRQALLQTSGIEKCKEECRDTRRVRWIEDFLQDGRFALRMLRKSPGFTAVAVLTLALGVGANTTILSIVDAVLLRPLPYPEPSRLVHFDVHTALQTAGRMRGMSATAAPDRRSVPVGDFLDWQKEAQSFKRIAAVGGMQQTILTGAGTPDQAWAVGVSANFFQTAGVPAAYGTNVVTANTVVLSDAYWRARFDADPGVVGRSLKLDDKAYTVAGVMPRGFFVEGSSAELWMPLIFSADEMADHTKTEIEAIGRLKNGVGLEQARAEMNAIENRRSAAEPGSATRRTVEIAPLGTQEASDLRPAIFALLGAVIFTLLIGCANVASLFLARGTGRRREMAVRAALGAGRDRLVRQLFTESAVVSCLGAGAGLILASAGLHGLQTFAPAVPMIARAGSRASINAVVLAFTAGLGLLTTLAVGAIPAWKAARLNFSDSLKDGAPGSGISSGRLRAQEALVTVEIALSLVLLVGAVLLGESFYRLMTVRTGFDASHVLTAEVPQMSFRHNTGAAMAVFYGTVLSHVGKLPGVKAASIANNFPLSDREVMLTLYPGELRKEAVHVEFKDVTPGYFAAMGIPLVSGRDFTLADTANTQGVAIVNESMARRYWQNGDAIGKPLYGKVVIVGVVGDTIQSSLRTAPAPTAYRPYDQQPLVAPFATLVVRAAGDPLKLAPAIRSAVQEIEPDQPVVQLRSMNEVVDDSVAQPRFSAAVFAVLAISALLLSMAGIYGVMAYSVSQRTHEIGVRIALGARPQDLLTTVLRRGLLIGICGTAAGAAVAVGLTRFLASLLFQVKPVDPLAFAGAASLLIVVALAACLVPARRAMRVDPMEALRHE